VGAYDGAGPITGASARSVNGTKHLEYRKATTSPKRGDIVTTSNTSVIQRDDGGMATAALAAMFRERGYVVLPGALDAAYLAELAGTFDRAFTAKRHKTAINPVLRDDVRQVSNGPKRLVFSPEGGNHDFNRWNMHLPSEAAFFSPVLLEHPSVLPLLHSLLGDDCLLIQACADINMPGSGFQMPHQDDFRGGVVSVNVALTDVTLDMGPLEFWPRSHLTDALRDNSRYTVDEVRLSVGELAARVERLPSMLFTVPAGSILIRDQRMVHRGTPNRSALVRPHLTYNWVRAGCAAHRSVAMAVERFAKRMRLAAIDEGTVRRPKLFAWGAYLDRRVDELAGDRNHFRPLPSAVWSRLPAASQRALRLARSTEPVAAHEQVARGIASSAWLLIAAGAVAGYAAASWLGAPYRPPAFIESIGARIRRRGWAP
jgi:ectoine hydroxylase-related dioxygenase (phytanoyl-CoA dioxygenase family)